MRNKHLTNSSYYRKMPISDWKYAENKMNAIIKLLMGLGCLGMYLGWRYAPETSVVGIGLNTLAIYGSLAVVAAGFGLAVVFGRDEAPVSANEPISRDHESADLSMRSPHTDGHSNAFRAEDIAGAIESNAPLYDPTFAGVDARYDSFGWRTP